MRAEISVPTLAASVAAIFWLPLAASAYPGGTPEFQTDMATACAACHSSVSEDALAGSGPRAAKELAENKHVALILSGQKGYQELSEDDRRTLAEHVRAVDANSSVTLEFPPQVAPGESFQVTVHVTGGAGPVVGVGLVDRAHRWYSRPASSVGWVVVGPPTVIGPDGRPQSEWLNKRPQRFGREVTFVNITGVESDAAAGKWAKSKVVFTLKAPDKPGDYPLVVGYWYGTEKASPLGYTDNAVYGRQPRGGYTGKSGRIRFSGEKLITVKPVAAVAN